MSLWQAPAEATFKLLNSYLNNLMVVPKHTSKSGFERIKQVKITRVDRALSQSCWKMYIISRQNHTGTLLTAGDGLVCNWQGVYRSENVTCNFAP